MFTRVMMRPRPRKKVEAAVQEPEVKVSAEYKRCANCVSRKLCDDVNVCMYGKKAVKGKKNARNGRSSAK